MDLFPPAVEPHDSGHLDVSDGNSLYWETVGSPTGVPVIHLHGGPGSGCTPGMRRYFDPDAFRAVLFDQRGCGRSTPPRVDDPGIDLSTNTTVHSIADIERLRVHLGIEQWIVTGLSWGVTLGLAYAQAHPERVIGMALGAITSAAARRSTGSPATCAASFPPRMGTIRRTGAGERAGRKPRGRLCTPARRSRRRPSRGGGTALVRVGGHPRLPRPPRVETAPEIPGPPPSG